MSCVPDPSLGYNACEKQCPCAQGDGFEQCGAGGYCDFGGGGCGSPASNACSNTSVLVEFQSCVSNPSGCPCPMQCFYDPLLGAGGQVCETPESSSAACPDPDTVLGACGNCTLNSSSCIGKTVGDACDSTGTDDGTCVLHAVGSNTLLVCEQAGTATGTSCSTSATRQEAADLCTVGSLCVYQGGSLFSCTPICDTNAPNCPGGATCTPGIQPGVGSCPSCGTGGAGEYGDCTSNADCQCAFECSGNKCLTPCPNGASACQATETCQSGFCEPNSCTDYLGSCTAGTGGTGTCVPFQASDGGPAGACTPAGTATLGASCDLPPTSSSLSSNLCLVGDGCTQVFVVGGADAGGCGLAGCVADRCAQACDPTGTLGTPACTSGKCTLATGVINPSNNPYDGFCQ